MELLLIFSAMLSALTGAFTGAREPEARFQQAEAAISAEAAVVAIQAQTPRLVASPSVRAPTIDLPPPTDFAIVAAAPLAFVRLIE